jgi:hypothetical protein
MPPRAGFSGTITVIVCSPVRMRCFCKYSGLPRIWPDCAGAKTPISIGSVICTSLSVPALSVTTFCALTSNVTSHAPFVVCLALACLVSNFQNVFFSNRSASSGLSESGVTVCSSRYMSNVVASEPRFFWMSVRNAWFTRSSPMYSLSACIVYGPLR